MIGLMVVIYHDRGAAGLELVVAMIVDLLTESETLVTELGYRSPDGNAVELLYLRHEVALSMHDHNRALVPVYTIAYGLKIVDLARIVELEVRRIVYMAEAVPVFPAYLDGQTVMELYFFHIGM